MELKVSMEIHSFEGLLLVSCYEMHLGNILYYHY